MGDTLGGVLKLLVMLRDLEHPGWDPTPGSADIDFCEHNYEVDDGVAEPWAALGSLLGAGLGLGSAVTAYAHNLEPRMTMLWIIGAWWGLATAMMVSNL